MVLGWQKALCLVMNQMKPGGIPYIMANIIFNLYFYNWLYGENSAKNIIKIRRFLSPLIYFSEIPLHIVFLLHLGQYRFL